MDHGYDGTKETDRRERTRKPSNSRMWADPGGVLPVVDCRIIDITDKGAQVAALRGGELPDRFLLQMDSTRIVGEAHVVWRNGDVVGVRFVHR